jgi:hypothetical protein
MKNIYIVLFLLFSSFINAQKVDYDQSSKWFWGLNLGGTWQTTDVSNKTGAGWGIIIGKSYNYNYGKPFSFDIRARYLNGNWYGQDSDSSKLSGLEKGSALYGYQNGLGYTYHNYKSNVHRLALELAIHLNALTQRTGLDPYVFGGVGITWNRTYGNLTDSSNLLTSPTLYNYTQNGISNISFDNSYETALDGYSNYRANFMPSLGFGLGYHIRKRTTIGFEHKTTFTLKDNFDAVNSTLPRSKNDLYHYTSLYLKFRLRARGSVGGSSTNNNTNFNTSCPLPIINIISQNNQTTNQGVFKIQATISNVSSSNFIKLTGANNLQLPFIYNSATKNFEATVNLTQGANTFYIKADNNCGNDNKSITINYNNCSLPSGSFTNPINGQVSVQSPNYVISALLNGIQNASNIAIYQNGTKLITQSFNVNSGVVQANVILQAGVNNFRIDLTNACGTSSLTTTVNYNNCIAPNIQVTSPSSSGSTVGSSNYNLTAQISNFGSGNTQVTLNGVNLTNYTNNNGQLQVPLNLSIGNNTITIRTTNNCGTDSETTTINYQNCSAPIITINQPSMNAISNVALATLKAKVENAANKQSIQVLLNNINVPVFSYNANTKMVEANLTLIPGSNTITISSTNSCGSDIETITLNYDNCKAPIVDITNTTNQTQNMNAYVLNATVQNMPSTDGLVLTQNGTVVNYSYVNGVLSSAVSLLPGVNTFKLSATRSCGNSSETIVVNYNDCIAPSVSILNPAGAGLTVNNSNFIFKAIAINITNNQQIDFKFNGQTLPVTLNNGQIEANVTLINGNNSFSIKVSNTCGNDSKTSSVNLVNCVPPQISVNNPISNNTTVTNSVFTYQATISGINSASGISFKQNGQTKPFNFSNGILSASITLVAGNNNISITATNDCGVDIETSAIIYDNCVPPVITFTNPNQLNITTTNSQFNIQAQITNSTSQGITLTQNGISKTFNFSNNVFTSLLTLIPGNNTIAVSTTNSCGNDIQFINVTYNNCIAPVLSITHPSIAGNTVNNASYNFEAVVENISAISGITLTHNGNVVSGASLNNGQISANINLVPGLNSFSVAAINACGNAVKTTTVNYNNCSAPVLNILSPSTNATTVTSANYTLSLSASNIENVSQVSLTQNGTLLQNVSLANGQITSAITLVPGVNNFYASINNSCGNDSKNFSINYDNCIAPSVTINNVSTSRPTYNSNYLFSANLQNINSSQGISLTLNGTSIPNFNFVNGLLTANVVLSQGSNIFVVTVQNSCGTNNASLTVNYENCNTPIIHVNTNPVSGSTTSSSQISFSAQILNFNSNTVIDLSMNGTSVNNFTNNNGVVNYTANLPIGQTSILLSATNGCGSDMSTYTINRCENATASLINPSAESTLSSVSNQSISFNISNANPNSISISQNGTVLSNFNLISNSFSGNVNLVEGLNTFVLSINTPCNQITKTITITYQPVSNQSGNNTPTNLGGSGADTTGTHNNNGHGNNEDGVDSSNPGQGSGGPNGQTDTNGGVDDENGNGGNTNSNQSGSNAPTNVGGSGADTTGTHNNNGHGNNTDGIDSSNPGQGSGGPNGQTDTNGGVDDENGNGGSTTPTNNGGSTNQGGSNTPTNNGGSTNQGGSNTPTNNGGSTNSSGTNSNSGNQNNGGGKNSNSNGSENNSPNSNKQNPQNKSNQNKPVPVVKDGKKDIPKTDPKKNETDTSKTNKKETPKEPINPVKKTNVKGGGR